MEFGDKNKAAFCPHCQRMTFVADYTDNGDNRKEVDAMCVEHMKSGYTIKDVSNDDVKELFLGHTEECFFTKNPIKHEEWEDEDDEGEDEDDEGEDDTPYSFRDIYEVHYNNRDLEKIISKVRPIHRQTILDLINEIADKTSTVELVNLLENHLKNLQNEQQKTRRSNQSSPASS